MFKLMVIVGLGLCTLTLTGCVAGAGYETYSGPVYFEPEPVVVGPAVVVARPYRHYRRDYYGRRYYDGSHYGRRHYDPRHRYDYRYRHYPRG